MTSPLQHAALSIMDSVSLSNKDVRRHASGSSPRRASRGGISSSSGGGGGGNVGINLLSSLSQALDNLDRYNDALSREGNRGDDGGDNGNGSRRYFDGSETITFTSSSSGINDNNNNTINHNNNDNASNNAGGKSPHRRTKKPSSPPPSQFSSYLKFNRNAIYSLLAFVVCYLLVLICCYPMVYYSNVDVLPTDDDYANGGRHHIKRGSSFEHMRGRKQYVKAKVAFGRLREKAVKAESRARKAFRVVEREVYDSMISGGTIGRRDGEDAMKAKMLLERAIQHFEDERSAMEDEEKKRNDARERGRAGEGGGGGHDHWKDALEAWDGAMRAAPPPPIIRDANDAAAVSVVGGRGIASGEDAIVIEGKTPGFMVLGMHRSGTSMLSGLLAKGFGYETGGPLIGASFDNEKGFYERIDVVLQNDEFMAAQKAGWSWNVLDYDPDRALEHKTQGTITFKEGKTALKFLNNHQKTLPYLQKDPRMCITLPTWLKLLDDKPAIVFTYRHPLEVALSLKHREAGFTMEHGLRLWIAYNMRALKNSAELCRVFSTNEAVFNDPAKEVQRIKDELTTKCNVIPPPIVEIPIEVVNAFVDPKLQHNKKGTGKDKDKQKILKDFGNGCVALDFESDYEEKSANRRAEVEMYLMAMKVFCDMENGPAYKDDYEWPDLLHWKRPAKIN